MSINLTTINGVCIAEIISDNIEMKDTQDALDILANCRYQGAENIILHEKNIIPDFFDLKTTIAGEILQKFSTYDTRLAIVGDFSKYTRKSLKDFIYESNKGGRISFVNTIEEATEKLVKYGRLHQ
jgi:hypothetical protein